MIGDRGTGTMTRSVRCSLSFLTWILASLLGASQTVWCAESASDVVRWDWQFRESLNAIRDWESLLARLEKKSPDERQVPILPVPGDGRSVIWPNPIPRVLLAEEDRGASPSLRLANGKLKVQGAARDVKTLGLDQEILGYTHPGGGGKDQWYHRYERRFDQLLRFRAKHSPLAITLDAPFDFRRGHNEIDVQVCNVTDKPATLTARLDVHRPAATRQGESQAILVPPGEDRPLRFPLDLVEPGGGLAVLTLPVDGESFRIPLLTHVEDVAAVLKSIEQILDDTPDAVGADGLAALRRRTEAFDDTSRHGWRALFEEASQLRDQLLLGRVQFETLLFVKRKPYFSEQPFMDAHHLFNRPGGGIYRLSPVRPNGTVTAVVDSLGDGVYRDVCLHFSGEKLLFSFGNGSDKWDGGQSYDIHEIGIDGADLQRLTSGPKNDCEPFYLPDGRIGFTSDRSEHFVMCGGDRHSPTLFVAEADGSAVRQLSFNVFNDFNPCVLPDGRILYSRWEYNERSVTSLHNPFTMNSDGTMVAPYYGNATIRPNVVMFPRPVPGSRKVMALFTAHHGQTHGAVGLIDIRRGRDGPEPLEILTPNVPITGEHFEDSRCGWFSDPVALSETTYLCSYTPTVLPWLERSWALYVGDRHGNLALVYRDPDISGAEPLPLVLRPRPFVQPLTPTDTGATDAEATLAAVDVNIGLDGVPRGAAKFLRILEDVPRKDVRSGGVVLTSGTLIFTIKRILGTVPIEADGSAHFVVPANRNVYFEVLDARHQEIQRMRSVVCLKPGEQRTCVGCHESRNTAPPNRLIDALDREPSRPREPPWGQRIISYLRDVQPLVSARCTRCHTHDRMANGVILTDDLTDQFTVAYEELLPYLSVAISNRWDHPDDVYARPPYTYGSKASRLMTLLDSGHHDVELTEEDRLRLVNWIDANAVYYDRYESDAYGPKRHIFAGPIKGAIQEVHKRRCVPCHGSINGRHDTWWLTINWHDAKMSRALVAPLARSAGGWQRCGELVFADTSDPDYQKLLSALTSLGDQLAARPREDLLSVAGTDAAQQSVELPPPPPPRPAVETKLSPGEWVPVSDLPWESANSGWTSNGDGLPRRDRDVRDQMLRLDGRRYGKGIGTHAPSEIVYRLDGKYDRFSATLGGAEERGTIVFQVFGDSRQLFDSGVMHGLRGTKSVDVSVANVKQLRLVVTDAGDNYFCDMANWADARLRKADSESRAEADK